jgi:hypothetical protein
MRTLISAKHNYYSTPMVTCHIYCKRESACVCMHSKKDLVLPL